MRAGPLSNSQVIHLLNRSFVPVYTVNEDYAPKGSAPAEEKAERERIFQQGYERRWSVGTVHVYVLRPDAQLFGTLHVAQALLRATQVVEQEWFRIEPIRFFQQRSRLLELAGLVSPIAVLEQLKCPVAVVRIGKAGRDADQECENDQNPRHR